MRYTILGLIYITLFAVGFTILEELESKKVFPFEHVQIGFYYSVYIGFLIFIVVYLPLTFITDFLPKKGFDKHSSQMFRIFLFSSVGVVIGAFMFPFINPEWAEIDGFILNRETSLIIFGAVGFLYSVITIFFRKNVLRKQKNV